MSPSRNGTCAAHRRMTSIERLRPRVRATTTAAKMPMSTTPAPAATRVQRVVAVEEHRHQQCRPQDGIEHQRRAHALHAQGEAGVGSGHAGLVEEAVGDGCPRCGASRHDVAHGQARHVDPQQAGATRALVVQHRVGELAVGHPRRALEDDAGDHVGDVDPSQQVDGLAGAGELGQDQVLENEDEADRVETPFDLSAYPPTPGDDSVLRRHRGHASTSAVPARAIPPAAVAGAVPADQGRWCRGRRHPSCHA